MFSASRSPFLLHRCARGAALAAVVAAILGLSGCASYPEWSTSGDDAVETPVPSDRFPLPADGTDVVGDVQITFAREEDTLHDIARRYDLGYERIPGSIPGCRGRAPGSFYPPSSSSPTAPGKAWC